MRVDPMPSLSLPIDAQLPRSELVRSLSRVRYAADGSGLGPRKVTSSALRYIRTLKVQRDRISVAALRSHSNGRILENSSRTYTPLFTYV